MLTLLGFRGIGPQLALRILRRFPTLSEVKQAPEVQLEPIVPTSVRVALRDLDAWEKALSRARKIVSEAEYQKIEILTPADKLFPEMLRRIPDCPAVLYAKGCLRPGNRYAACVGTREPSQFGVTVTRRIVAVLAANDWSIVSGLALGVDAVAHESALAERTHTVAILANGLDSVYPKANAKLADSILAAGGVLLSEQPPGTPVIPRNLVQRDRLQSGMSIGTVVMQTDVTGGSMHTVRFTLTQKRLLFVPVPSGQYAVEPKSQGLLALARLTGPELSRVIKADGEYGKLLTRDHARSPVAVPLASREDYDTLLSRLDVARRSPVASDPQTQILKIGDR